MTDRGFHFIYKGGANKPTLHTKERLYAFFTTGQGEIPIWDAIRNGIVAKVGEFEYSSSLPKIKIFTDHQGFGVPKLIVSVWIDMEKPYNTITITSPAEESVLLFEANGCIMEPESASKFDTVKHLPPKEVLQRMIKSKKRVRVGRTLTLGRI